MKYTQLCFVILISLFGLKLSAQPWFEWEYIGPDTIEVGANCRGTLDWGGDENIIITETLPNQFYTLEVIHISGGYSEGSQVPAGVTVTVTYQAVDVFGHVEQFSFTIYFADLTPPVFNSGSLPPDITLNCPTNLPPASVSATDNCTPAFQISITVETNFPPMPCSGQFERTWTASDLAGNESQYTQIITITPESQAPVITTEANDMTGSCTGQNIQEVFDEWIATHGGAEAMDNCGIFGWQTLPANPVISDDCAVPTTITFIVTDFCGNSDSTTATFQMNDAEPPVLVSEALDIAVSCDTNLQSNLFDWLNQIGQAVITDNCVDQSDLILTFQIDGQTYTQEELYEFITTQSGQSCQSTEINGVLTENITGLFDIDFLASDYCANSVSTQATFAVTDTTAPVILADGIDTTTVSCIVGSLEEAFTDWFQSGAGAEAGMECGNPVWIGTPTLEEALNTLNETPGCNKSVSVTFRLADVCLNISTGSFTSVFRVFDNVGPAFNPPASNYEGVCAFDSGVQDTLIQWIESKGQAGIEDCNQAVWDHFSWQTDTGESGEGLFGVGPYPEITDNGCGQFIEVVFFGADNCDNISSDTAFFNVSDNLAPVILTAPANLTIDCGVTIPTDVPTFSDNCTDDLTIDFTEESTQNPNTQSCAHYTYTITRVWTATDECDNSTEVTQVIEVKDTIAPIADMVFEDEFLSCENTIEDIIVNFSDNCSPVSQIVTESNTQGTDELDCSYYNYSVFQQYIVSDVCNNTDTLIRTIFVNDTTAPEISLLDTLTLDCLDSAQVAFILQTLAADNCALTLSFDISRLSGQAGDCSDGRIENWALTATDPCGNFIQDTIPIKVFDNVPPELTSPATDLILYCEDGSDYAVAFENWLSDFGGAQASDACGETFSFIAVHGSYSHDDTSSFPGVYPTFDQAISCDSNHVLSLDVDFVFLDNCNNIVISRALFAVNDTVSPVLLYCQQDTTIILPEDQCSTDYILGQPTVLDECNNFQIDTTLTNRINISSENPGNSLVLVNPERIEIGPLFNGPSFATYTGGGVELVLYNTDMEAAEEFFNITDENGEFLISTQPTPVQCDTSVTIIPMTIDQYNLWSQDGYIYFVLTPNDPSPLTGDFGVNDICTNSYGTASLDLSWNTNNSLIYEFSIDSSDFLPYNPFVSQSIELQTGVYDIEYRVSDCGGNAVSCIQQVAIRDTVPPTIECSNNISVTLGNKDCDTTLTIPLPLSYEDNCGLNNDFSITVPHDSATAWLTFDANPNLGNFIANDKIYTFHNVTGQVTNPVTLNIYIRGDVESGGEYFTIMGEDGNEVGTTEPGPPHVLTGSCSKVSKAYFNIPAATFNEWAADGQITIQAISNKNFTIPPGNSISGINPCPADAVTMNGQTDSSSFMFMEFTYSTFISPVYFVTGATQIEDTELPPPYTEPIINFNSGVSNFSYYIEDRSGNRDTCTIEVLVIDDQAPKAFCRHYALEIHPSGIIPTILNPSFIDNGSIDNCNIDTMYVIPDTFNCNQIGTEVEVVLYVVDPGGLSDSCTAIVRPIQTILNPTYSLGLCDNDSLRLFANIQDTALFNAYTYSWTGPGGFVSDDVNPVIPNANENNSGSYVLTIEGLGGCTASGVVQVFINGEINTPIIAAQDSTVCSGQQIVLFTQPYTGNITYKWYEGVAPMGILLDSTIIPQYQLTKPEGVYSFYVIVSENDCVSNPSASVEVSVLSIPAPEVDHTLLNVCEGQSIQLGTSYNGQGVTYRWTGPNGFNSNDQYPPAIDPALPIHAGVYTLVVNDGSCFSLPATTTVSVSPKPTTPQPFSNGPVCINNTLTLTSNIVLNIDTFVWKKPDGTLILVTSNPLVIPNASLQDDGLWTLTLNRGGCLSNESTPIDVEVNQELSIQISYEGPLCEGDSVTLSATNIFGAQYHWSGPGGFNSNLQSPRVKAAFGSYYVTVTSPNGCLGYDTTSLNLFTKPRITGLSSTAEPCFYPDESITFNYNLNLDPDSVTYAWSASNGFNSTEAFPVIFPDANTNGIYSLIVTSVHGCHSDTVRITINSVLAPPKPIITGENQYCSGENILLTLPNMPAVGQYLWQTPSGDIQTTVNSLNIANAMVSNSGLYRVMLQADVCPSKFSESFEITVNQTPDRPVILGDATVCIGDSIILRVSAPADYLFAWTGPGGLTSSQKDWIIHPAQSSNAGNYFLTVTNGNCVSEASDAFTLIINAPPASPVLAETISSLCAIEEEAVLTLCVTSGSATAGANYTFYNSETNTVIGGPTNALCVNISDFTGIPDGQNTFHAIATLQGCSSPASVPVAVDIIRPPQESASAGSDSYVCEGNQGLLSAQNTVLSTGTWVALTNGTIVENASSASTSVSNLQPGANYFLWSLSFEDCVDFSRDTVIIWLATPVDASDDFYRFNQGENMILDILNNDSYITPLSITTIDEPSFGSVTVGIDQTLFYSPSNTSAYEKFTYRICVLGCPDICSDAEVLIDIDNPTDCKIPNIITPNNDRINDVLFIPCLETLTNNNSELSVFNEWGHQVFHASPYLNDWNGFFEGRPLPSGTYFYVFRSSVGAEIQKGFLIIKN